MHDKEIELLEQRVKNFSKRIGKLILRENVPLEASFRHCPKPVPFAARLEGDYRPVKEGEGWGRTWESAWFHLAGRVPKAWKGRHVAAWLCFNGEGLVFDRKGAMIQGITNSSVFDRTFSRDVVSLFSSAKGGESVELWVEAACNGLFGVNRQADPEPGQPDRYGSYSGSVNRIRLAVVDDDLWHLRLDVMVLADLLVTQPRKSVRHSRVLRALSRAIDVFGDDPANAAAARAVLAPELARPAHASALTAVAVGHAHIDTGWLWPVRESIRKCARTFSSQLRLIDRYPGYVFGASQAQHYAFVKEHYPALYQRIRQAVRDGSWECQGGMWVEADANLVSGESMVRQFVFGKHFFMDEFGVDVRNLWLPDVFGYSGSMPQIMKKAGCDYFVTQKISWSQTNRFPHSTFRWRGIDGTEVLTHFPPEDTYNGSLRPDLLQKGVENFQERGFIDGFLSLFGIGDGGGGPHEEHIEFGLRQADLEGSPRVVFGPAQAYLDRIPSYHDDLPVWSGELYLELHRGTLTTQARTKRANRMLENRLRQVEFLWSCLSLAKYPKAALDSIWQRLLLNQFHDILPGSSIKEVYDDAARDHAEALAACDRLLQEAAVAQLKEDADSVTLVNCLSYAYCRPVALPAGWGGAVTGDGGAVTVQDEDGTAVAAVEIPPQGTVTLHRGDSAAVAARAGRGLVLENALIRYEFDKDGTISRVYDKEAVREVLEADGRGNLLSLYEDRPNNWDAWDVDAFYEHQLLEHARSVRATRLPGGPVRQRLRFELAVGNSTLVQVVTLAADTKRLDIETTADWREKHRMLRVSFPVAVQAESFSSDIQYGCIQRPTHRNTSWDTARFEVAAHRYVDLSDRDYGVALLNDCKYGHKVHENVLDLNLLRSPTHPDPDADQGAHVFTYSLLPHTGTLTESPVMAEASCLNVPALVFEGRRGAFTPPCRLEGSGVSLEVIKRAEKSRTVVIRLVETDGRQSTCRIIPADPKTVLVETNLVEWTEEGRFVPGPDGAVELALTPYAIRTFKLQR